RLSSWASLNLAGKLDASLRLRTSGSSAARLACFGTRHCRVVDSSVGGMFRRSRSTNLPVPSERAIVAKAQRGEASAFELLYLAHQRRVFHLCYRMVNDWSRAEELTQDTFLQVYRELQSFR